MTPTIRFALIATTMLMTAPASAQLLGGGGVGGMLGGAGNLGGAVSGTLNGAGQLGSTVGQTSGRVSNTVNGTARAHGSRSIDTRSGRVVQVYNRFFY